jgi:hypothetical protein
MGQVLVTTNEGERTAVEAREDERVHGGVMASEAIQCKPTEFGKLVTIQESEHHITTMMRPSQRVLDFCPSQKKQFFCGIAKKFGCHFCAPK